MNTLSRAAVALSAALSLTACRDRRAAAGDDEHAQPPAPRPLATAADLAVDRALPGELAEGAEHVFGLPLPRVMKVNGRFDDVVYAAGDAPADQVANYVRQRLTADKIETGPEKTVFPRAEVKGSPGAFVAVTVVTRGSRTELIVRNATLKRANETLSPDERWRELGLKPDGTPLDPTHLH